MNRIVVVFSMALLFGSAAVPLAAHAKTKQAYPISPSIVAFDQKAPQGQLRVDFAHLPQQGYVAVYKADTSGKASGEPIGYTKLEKGEHRGFTVALSKEVKSGDQVWLAMYKDTDDDPSFDPGSLDQSVWSKDNLPSENLVNIK